jgi:hypothetical protein
MSEFGLPAERTQVHRFHKASFTLDVVREQKYDRKSFLWAPSPALRYAVFRISNSTLETNVTLINLFKPSMVDGRESKSPLGDVTSPPQVRGIESDSLNSPAPNTRDKVSSVPFITSTGVRLCPRELGN